MSAPFNPLGNFNPKAALPTNTIAQARELLHDLPEIKPGLITRIYLHWTVAGLCAEFEEYNAEAECANGHHILKVTHDPRDNAPGVNDKPCASHTWHRNTGALGIAITGMDGATTSNFGPDPVTVAGLETLCAGAAALCCKYGVDPLGRATKGSRHADNYGTVIDTTGERLILTHAECALLDRYPAERWDLGSLTPVPQGEELTPAMRTVCGNALRTRINFYKAALEGANHV